MSSHLANGVFFPLDFTFTKIFKTLSYFTFDALHSSKLVDSSFCSSTSRRFLEYKTLKKTHIFVFNKFTHSASSALVHAFSHAIRAKSLLFLTLISEFVLPFLPPSLRVDDQSTSLVVELPFFHNEGNGEEAEEQPKEKRRYVPLWMVVFLIDEVIFYSRH